MLTSFVQCSSCSGNSGCYPYHPRHCLRVRARRCVYIVAIPVRATFVGYQVRFPVYAAYSTTYIALSFMDINWQYNDPPNPADAAIGPQGYDNHLYYS
jgi:hypothetical protein